MAISIAESLHIGLADITTRKVRSAATIFGIILGVISILVVLAILNGMNASTLSWMEERGGTNKVEVHRNWNYDFSKGGEANLTLAEVEEIRMMLPEAVAFNSQVMLYSHNELKYRGLSYNSTISGVLPDFLQVENWGMSEGRFISDLDVRESSNVIVLGSSAARDLLGGKDAVGKKIALGGNVLEVIGILNEKNWEKMQGGSFGGNMLEYMNQQSFIPISTAINRYDNTMKVSSLQVTAESPNHALKLQKKLNQILLNLKGGRELFRVSSAQEGIMTMQANARIFSLIFILISAISLLVAGIVIMNIMLASIKERTREIGVRIAVGARRIDIFFQFMIQTVLITTLGGVIGIGLGLLILDKISAYLEMEMIADFRIMISSVLVSVMVGLIFGIMPAIRAGNLDPVDALREE
ncbi:MAG: ABC transporter permease [Candidatus Cloacimonadaceae bacterium]